MLLQNRDMHVPKAEGPSNYNSFNIKQNQLNFKVDHLCTTIDLPI
jgi:hypothetical protein